MFFFPIPAGFTWFDKVAPAGEWTMQGSAAVLVLPQLDGTFRVIEL